MLRGKFREHTSGKLSSTHDMQCGSTASSSFSSTTTVSAVTSSLLSSHLVPPSAGGAVFCVLTALPPVLLALICHYLSLADLLRLLRCCCELRVLNASDASFSSAVWCSVVLHLRLDRLPHEWALPYDSCIHDPSTDTRHIPLSLWQQAVPVMEHTFPRWGQSAWSKRNDVWQQGMTALTTKQPTTTIRVDGEKHVVLSKLTWDMLRNKVPRGFPCYRNRFVLSATPHLQHLHILLDASKTLPLPLLDIVALVPRLRSLQVEMAEPSLHYVYSEQIITPNHAVLSQLPHLTHLTCMALHLTTVELIDIAAHATLEHIHLHGAGPKQAFHSDGEEQEQEHTEDRAGAERSQGAGGKSTDVDGGAEDAATATARQLLCRERDMARLSLALVRVTPTRRSIRARLELAEFLQNELSQQGERDRVLCRQQFSTSLQHCRQQVDLLQSTLRSQLVVNCAC